MTVRDVTPTAEDFAASAAAVEALSKDIHERWPAWMAIVREHPIRLSSHYMVVATCLMGQALMAMLQAQVAPPDVLRSVEGMFDLLTGPTVHDMTSLRDDKVEIMGFIERIMDEQVRHLAKHRQVN